MAHINGSGVQQHSAGDHFPYVVYLREFYSEAGELIERRIIVSLAGAVLAAVPSWREGHELARLFKRLNVRTVADGLNAQVLDMQADMDAEKFTVSRSEGMKRQRNDYAVMYGDAEHVPFTGREVLAWKCEQARKFEETERAYQEREAGMAAAREEFYASAEADGTDVDALELARRALGIIA